MFLLHFIFKAFVLAQNDILKAPQFNLEINGIMNLELFLHIGKS